MNVSYAEAVSHEAGSELAKEISGLIDEGSYTLGEILFAVGVVAMCLLKQVPTEHRLFHLGRFCMNVAEGVTE